MALELDPNIKKWVSVGHTYRMAGAYDKALKIYKQAIVQGSKGSPLYGCLGVVYEKMNNIEMAYYYSKKALKIDPKNPVAKETIKRINNV